MKLCAVLVHRLATILPVLLLTISLPGCTEGQIDSQPEAELVGTGLCAHLPHPGGHDVLTVKANYSTSQGHRLPPAEEIVLAFKYDANRTTIANRQADTQGCAAFAIPSTGQYWVSAVRRWPPTDECAWSDGNFFTYKGGGFTHMDLSLTVTCN